MVKKLSTKAEFDQALKALPAGKLMVVDFTASWCGPCKMISPKFEAMSEEFSSVEFYKVDVDENDETAKAEGIHGLPTFKFYQDGRVLGDLTLGANEAKLRDNIAKLK
jgi:thioredoxin